MSTTLRILICIALAGSGAGCESFKSVPDPPNYLVIEGKGAADPSAIADRVPWAIPFSGPMTAEAVVNIEAPHIPDDPGAPLAPAAQEGVMAAAAARRAGLRALAEKIGALPDSSRAPISSSFDRRPELAAALGKMIETDAQVITSRGQNQTITAEASIDGPAVLNLLKQFNVPFNISLNDVPQSQQQEMKMQAYNRAIEDARERLKKQILALKDKDGRLLANAFEEQPERMRELDAVLFMLQADETKYNADGSCEVQLIFDGNEALKIAGQGSSWLPWRR